MLRLTVNFRRFIGVDDKFAPDMSFHHNSVAWPRLRYMPVVTRKAEYFIARSIKHLPKPMRSYALKEFRQFTRTEASSIDPPLRSELIAFYHEDILRTQELIGRDLSHWLNQP